MKPKLDNVCIKRPAPEAVEICDIQANITHTTLHHHHRNTALKMKFSSTLLLPLVALVAALPSGLDKDIVKRSGEGVHLDNCSGPGGIVYSEVTVRLFLPAIYIFTTKP